MGQAEREQTIKALCQYAKTSNLEKALEKLNNRRCLTFLSEIYDLSLFKSLSNLETLCICKSEITDLTPLTYLPNLKNLYFHETK
ncbi:MAG: hypothetical protein SAJ37_24105, partial [Oscillatoria sp. PMC 1068.18]|nr:hypothetical protein [Oscillatoria sp. PMC 1068.18]